MADAGYLELEEGTEPGSPASGFDRVYTDIADGKLKKKNSAGAVTVFANSNVDSVFGRTGTVVALPGDYTASQVTNVPAGGLSAITVQAAINELDAEKAPITHVGSTGVSQHGVATGVVAGFMSPSDKTKLDGVATGATATPLSGSTPQPLGTASAGSATDASKSDHVHAHGDQAGGTLHPAATTSVNGFMSSSDKTKLDGISSGATALNLSNTTPMSIGTASPGTDTDASRSDHVHAHGTQAGGSLHAQVTTVVDGFMIASDKSKLNGIAAGATANSSDAFLLARANHTGTQLLATISDVTVSAANVNAIQSGADYPGHFHATDRARANHTGTQVLATISDVTVTATQVNALYGGGDITGHFHSADRARANHTGTQLLATISDITITAANINNIQSGVDYPGHFHAADRARANHTGTQTLSTISDVTVTATQVNNIQSGVDYPGHFHASDRARANHTGTQLLSTISDVTVTAAQVNAIQSGADYPGHFHATDRARANHTGSQPLSTISDVTVTATQVNNIQSGADYPGHFHATDRARANHTGTQLLATISDVTITASQVNALYGGGDITGHFHSTDRARANHTGTQLAATISDFNSAAQSATLASAITSGVTDKAPNEDTVYNALYQAPDRIALNTVAVTGTSYTILITDKSLIVSNAAAVSIQLPNPATRRRIYIQDTAGTRETAPITLVRFGSESIMGLSANKVLYTNFGGWYLEADGANWWIK